MNKKRRHEVASVFLEATDDLWGGHSSVSGYTIGPFKEKYICYILENNFSTIKISNINKRALKIIADRLEGYNCLESWLMSKGIPQSELTDVNVQTHRRNWLYRLWVEFNV